MPKCRRLLIPPYQRGIKGVVAWRQGFGQQACLMAVRGDEGQLIVYLFGGKDLVNKPA